MMYPGRRHDGNVQTEDLLNDPFFQDWILHPTDAATTYWTKWMTDHPAKVWVVEDARKILLSVRFVRHQPEEEQVRRSLSESLTRISELETADISANRPGSGLPDTRLEKARGAGIRRMGRWGRVAALVAGLALTGTITWFLLRRPSQQIEITGYGTLKTVYLPDSSRVVLNAHSSLRYGRDWLRGGNREVWLDGEAYFNVLHGEMNNSAKQRYAAFQVHMPALNVEVLGTSFDIRQRRGNTEIVLVTGKIRVSSVDGSFAPINLGPGDQLQYDSATRTIHRTATQAEDYVSWMDRKLILNNAPLSSIIRYIEDNFGKKVILQDPALAERTIGGEIRLENLQDALFILSKTLNITIEEKEDTILFKIK